MGHPRSPLTRRQALTVASLVVGLLIVSPGSSPARGVEEGVATFADHVHDRFLRIDLGLTPETTGEVIFVDGSDGLFWVDEPVDLVAEVDGTITVSYSGGGFHSPDAEFDPITWSMTIGATIDEVTDLDVVGTLSADRTEADLTITDGVNTYVLDDSNDVSGATAILAAVVDDLDSEDWAAAYGAFHPRLSELQSQIEFVAAMEDSLAPYGTVVSVATVGALDVADNGAGWDVGRSDLELTMLKDGCEAVYPTSIELVHEATWSVGGIGSITPDVEPAISAAGPIASYYANGTTPIEVPFTVIDDATGVCRVELWWRHQNELGIRTDWVLGPQGTTSPLMFVPSAGPGSYEFYTIAVDGASNVEASPIIDEQHGDPDATTYLNFPSLTPDYATTVAADDPIVYWRLNEIESSTAVDSANTFDGAYHGTVDEGWGQVHDDTAIQFDGTSTYITGSTDAAFALAATGQKTFEFWVLPMEPTGRDVIFHRGSAAAGYDYSVYWEDGEIGVTVLTSGGTERISATSGADTVPAEAPSYVVVTLNDATDTVEFFVNGASTAVVTTAWTGSSTSQDTDPIVIGRDDATADDYFAGILDEVAIYDSVLGPIQVKAHYLAGTWVAEP